MPPQTNNNCTKNMQHTSLNKCIVSIIIIYTWEYNYQCINITNHLFIIEKPPLYHLWVEGNMCLPPTSVNNTHNNNPRSRDLSPGITTALYDVLCQPNAHHITQDILLHCGDICDVYKNQYIQLGGILYSNITHLQYSKHTYNNQPFVYHIGDDVAYD